MTHVHRTVVGQAQDDTDLYYCHPERERRTSNGRAKVKNSGCRLLILVLRWRNLGHVQSC